MPIYRGDGGSGTSGDSASASQIAQYANDAENSANQSASSATAAANSASAASTSETNAAASSTSAANSASAASTSETNAATSESNAATSETNAASSATLASTSATNAATSESNAATSESNAASSASTATTQAIAASTSATNAANSASAASTSESNAATSETNAATSETNAASSATNAAASFDSFDDRYLGAKASDPSVDNDGDALLTGALYFNTTSNVMRVYDGSAWQAAYVSAEGYLPLSGGTMTGNLTLNANPSNNLEAATKQYVDDVAAEGIQYHAPVRVEIEGNVSVTYNNGISGVGATLTNAGTQAALVIDDITMVVNDRVLVYEQTDATQNGIYTVTDIGSASTNWVLTRATDADSYAPSDPDALAQGSGFFVEEGTLGAGEKYVCNTTGTIIFGTTNITFVQVATAQIYTGGSGININGSVITNTGLLTTGSTATNLTITSADINGGNIDGTIIGATTPAAGTFADLTATGNLTVDTNTLYVNSTNNRVGVGTNIPSSNLHVYNGADAEEQVIIGEVSGGFSNAAGVSLRRDGTEMGRINASYFNGLTFHATTGSGGAGTERMRIDTSGNVGIGTSSPSDYVVAPELVVDTGVAGGMTIKSSNVSTGSYGGVFFADGVGGDAYRGFVQYNHNNAGTQDALLLGAASQERMRITSGGKVGIGHSAPAAKLAILGSSNDTISEANANLCVEGGGGNGIIFGTQASAPFRSYIQSGFVDNLSLATYDLLLNPLGGNVGIGSAPVSTLSVAKANRVSGPTISISNTISDSSWAYGDVVGRLDFRSEDPSTTQPVRGRIESLYTDQNASGTTYPAYSGLSFQVAAVNTLSEAMLIDGYGKVGIGTTTVGQFAGVDVGLTVDGGGAYSGIAVTDGATTGSLTQGYSTTYLYNQANGNLLFGTNNLERMRIDTNGNVGIGEIAPAALLHVKATEGSTGETDPLARFERFTSGDNAYLDITVNNSTNMIGFQSTGTSNGGFTFGGATADLVTITSAGNVGIGTDAPVSYQAGPALNVGSTSNSYAQVNLTTSATGIGYIGFGDSVTGAARYQGLISFDHNSNIMGFGAGAKASPDVAIDSSGNVGIGKTTGIAGQLHVYGNGPSPKGEIRCSNAGTGTNNRSIVRVKSATSTYGGGLFCTNNTDTAYQTNATHVFNFDNGPLVFGANNDEKARIDSNGNLFVGKTSTSLNQNGAVIEPDGRSLLTSTNELTLVLNRLNAGTPNIVQFYVNTSNAGYIRSSAGGTPSFGSASDIRLKQNVTDHESELVNVMALRPVRWDWKDNTLGSGEGFVAQELEQTAWSDLVSENDEGYKQVNGLGPVETRLIKALQEAVTRIETLEAEVAALKGAN